MSGNSGRTVFLSFGAAGGLILLAWYDSLLLATLVAGILGWSWLLDWCKGTMYTGTERMDGKLCVVTGANVGIGKETAKDFVRRGARVIIACRDLKKAEEAKLEIIQETGITNKVEVMHLDLSSFKSVRKFASDLCSKEGKLDVLVNNAGVAFHPKTITEDGQEQVFQVNHLSNFLLTNLLTDLLKASGNARVINLSSLAHKWAKNGIQFDDLKWEDTKFDTWQSYGQSKLANILFTKEYARLNKSVNVYAVHPGAVSTELGRHYHSKIPSFLLPVTDLAKLFLKTPAGGAQTSIYCAVNSSLSGETGKYYADCSEAATTPNAKDEKLAKKLWSVSKELVGDITPIKPTGTVKDAFDVESVGTFEDVPSKTEELTEVPTSGIELSKNELLVESVESFDKSELNKTETREPCSGSEIAKMEINLKSINDEVEKFDMEGLKETDTKEPISPAELAKNESNLRSLNKEVENFEKSELKETSTDEINVYKQTIEEQEKPRIELIGGIENFDSATLQPVKTNEPLSGVELLKHELTHKAVHSDLDSFDSAVLKKTDTEEKNWLPNTEDIKEEKEKIDHLSGIESFDPNALTKVKAPEPLSGIELLKNELSKKAINEELEHFDKESMKNVEVAEKNILPDKEIMDSEKTRENLLKDVEKFPSESLTHTKTSEPLSGAELLKQELTMKSLVDSVSSFDSSALKNAETDEKSHLPNAEDIQQEKNHLNLLKEVESGRALSPVVPKEPLSGAALLRQELTHQKVIDGVTSFDKDGLKHFDTEEKVVLPDMATIETEKTHVEHLKSIGDFDPTNLKPVKVAEPLSGPEVTKQESMRTNISEELKTFDKSDLKLTETNEKVGMPDVGDIHMEKQLMDHLSSLENGVELKKTETKEPINPLELAKLEISKDQVEGEIQAFDRASLTPVVTEEKSYMPSAEDIKTEALKKELDILDAECSQSGDSSPVEVEGGAAGLRNLLEGGDRERRSSSEEWEKVSSDDVVDRNSSEC